MRTTAHPSPNFGERHGGVRPDLIVIHHTAMPSHDAARDRLCDPAAEVSAHYLIAQTGGVLALVPESLRAWHAGAGEWAGVQDVNSRSVGIELANDGVQPYPLAQMQALETLLAAVMARWAVPPERVIAHSDMAPGRKTDPGPRFDWRVLALAGLSVWPLAGSICEPATFHASARRFGYPNAPPDDVLAAFRLRFRPQATGPADATDAALATDLARCWPAFGVDPTPPTAY